MEEKSEKRQEYPQFKEPNILDELDHKIVRLLLEQPNIKKGQLAKDVGLSYSQLNKRLNKPSVKKLIADVFASTMEIMEKNANMAARRLAKLIQHEDPDIALQAIRMALHPILNQSNINLKVNQEVIYISRFGEGGQIISEKKEVPSTNPKNTFELLTGGKKTVNGNP